MLDRLFSGSPSDLTRWEPWGLAVMALGVVLTLFSDKIARGQTDRGMLVKLAGVLITALGALITIKIV